jgi:hypothetical protein
MAIDPGVLDIVTDALARNREQRTRLKKPARLTAVPDVSAG